MSDSLESFNDILTCLAGVLVLIVILVVLDSKQSKIFIPTPITRSVDTKEPMWIEVTDSGEMHALPVSELYDWAEDAIQGVKEQYGEGALAKLAGVPSTNGAYVVNLYQLAAGGGTLEVTVAREVEGHSVAGVDVDSDDTKVADWFGGILDTVDAERTYLAFIVRSSNEAFAEFKKARARAWLDEVDVAYTLVGNREVLQFAERGAQLGAQ